MLRRTTERKEQLEGSDLTRVPHDVEAAVDLAGHGVGGSVKRREAAAVREQARVQGL